MDNNLFDDLVSSIKEAGAIQRKEIQASRVTELGMLIGIKMKINTYLHHQNILVIKIWMQNSMLN